MLNTQIEIAVHLARHFGRSKFHGNIVFEAATVWDQPGKTSRQRVYSFQGIKRSQASRSPVPPQMGDAAQPEGPGVRSQGIRQVQRRGPRQRTKVQDAADLRDRRRRGHRGVSV